MMIALIRKLRMRMAYDFFKLLFGKKGFCKSEQQGTTLLAVVGKGVCTFVLPSVQSLKRSLRNGTS